MKRMKLDGVPACYHAMSRVVGGQHLFRDREKEVLRKMLWQVADFCGVEILTYCVMSNHFHVLVRVPSVATRRRWRIRAGLYPPNQMCPIKMAVLRPVRVFSIYPPKISVAYGADWGDLSVVARLRNCVFG